MQDVNVGTVSDPSLSVYLGLCCSCSGCCCCCFCICFCCCWCCSYCCTQLMREKAQVFRYPVSWSTPWKLTLCRRKLKSRFQEYSLRRVDVETTPPCCQEQVPSILIVSCRDASVIPKGLFISAISLFVLCHSMVSVTRQCLEPNKKTLLRLLIANRYEKGTARLTKPTG